MKKKIDYDIYAYGAVSAYKHSSYIQLCCVCNLIAIQKEPHLW